MFRNPREKSTLNSTGSILPSVGRPPTPPQNNGRDAQQSPYFSISGGNNTKTQPRLQMPVKSSPITRTSGGKRLGGRQNQSILNFFGKSEKNGNDAGEHLDEAPLFFKDGGNTVNRSPFKEDSLIGGDNEYLFSPIRRQSSTGSRYNEDFTPIKRRRLSTEISDLVMKTPQNSQPLEEKFAHVSDTHSSSSARRLDKAPKRRGGFVDDSSDEEGDSLNQQDDVQQILGDQKQNLVAGVDDMMTRQEDPEISLLEVVETTRVPLKPSADGTKLDDHDIHPRSLAEVRVPSLSREATSAFNPGDFGDEEFENEEFYEEGEEFMERRWMEEQRAMEIEFDEDSKSESGADSVQTPRSDVDESILRPSADESVALCPICNGSMKDLSEIQASSHVNACIDGNAEPLADPVQNGGTTTLHPSLPIQAERARDVPVSKRFQRAAIARPGQANPFSLTKNGKSGSAFTRLMSGHAEDAAWAEAANNEVQSRGKPAYQRTCPFYKIMPGFFICVDAFRYGKVEGQNAYFLSHFHSDHYIGLTSSWCHGPIYASKVTCNLMQQQLRVDPKWVVPLEFEKKVEVPNTNGVFVTMIPANHCPGSSLFLFEKVTGKHRDGTPKLTRVLHCGDFRACPAHINHPLLRPEVLDAVTGQNKQQILDTCYLDTTYLTPKYAFPGQHDVIDACAQMCISLSKEIIDKTDEWEKVKLERAGSAMTKFLEQGEKKEDHLLAVEEDQKPKSRGRLLVVIGTYSIGKERMCLGIAKALNSKIFAPPSKMRICLCLEDAELNARLTSNPLEAQVHMQMLMEIRAETLHDYMMGFKGHFSRVVGFRPTGWSYRPPTSRFTENPAVTTVLNSDGWKSRYSMRDLVPQRGSTRDSNCFGVPYSEHSSFRELTMFCCALRINRIIPTVNVGSARSREKMKGWIEKWDLEKKKNGLYTVEASAEGWGSGDGQLRYGV